MSWFGIRCTVSSICAASTTALLIGLNARGAASGRTKMGGESILISVDSESVVGLKRMD